MAMSLEELAAIEDDELYEAELRKTQRAALYPLPGSMPLYHWSPTRNRKGIARRGLVVGRPHVTHGDDDGWRASYLCFGPSPSLGWGLSGGMYWTESGEWDLWQTALGDLTEPYARVEIDNEGPFGIYEVRTDHRVMKRHLWLVGTRIKP